MEKKIKRFGILCNRKLLTQTENREFKKLEKEISGAMQKDETTFNKYIELFKEAIKPLIH
ncbi:hypothetical protein ES703_18834 [subsurface metagenome]